jgi:hypothetical protein
LTTLSKNTAWFWLFIRTPPRDLSIVAELHEIALQHSLWEGAGREKSTVDLEPTK